MILNRRREFVRIVFIIDLRIVSIRLRVKTLHRFESRKKAFTLANTFNFLSLYLFFEPEQ